MPTSRRVLAPLLAGGGAAVAFVAALLAFLLVDNSPDPAAGAQTYTSDEKTAVSAAATEAANLLSYRRAHFDVDFQRALNGVTANFAKVVERSRSAYKQTLDKGKFDLVAKITHSALVGTVPDDKVHGYVVLVSLNGFRSDQLTVPTAQQNLQITVVERDGKWLVDNVDNIGVQ